MAALLLLAGCGPAPPTTSILVVTLDTLRRDHVGVYGDARGLTPALDALAAEGLVHDAAYTTMPTTAPAHVSLFTGLYPSDHGSTRNGEPLLPSLRERDAASRLRDRGYATAAFVTSALAGATATGLAGFEIYDAPRGRLRTGRGAALAALAWLAVEPRRPVFVWLHLYDAHAPYGTADEKRRSFPVDRGDYGWVDAERYATPEERQRMAERYAAGVRSADAALGLFVEGAREELESPPLLLIASDHGESLDEHLLTRGFAYDHGKFMDPETIRIALVAVGPGVERGRSPGAVSIRDVYATLLRAGGISSPGAAGEGLRDVRTPSGLARAVGVQRRTFFKTQPELVGRHAGAATDGTHLVVVGEDGTLTQADPDAPPELLALATELAGQTTAGIGRRSEIRLDPHLLEALESLGYVE